MITTAISFFGDKRFRKLSMEVLDSERTAKYDRILYSYASPMHGSYGISVMSASAGSPVDGAYVLGVFSTEDFDITF